MEILRKSYLLGNIYKPPGGWNIAFCTEMCTILKKCYRTYRSSELYLCSDLNIDILRLAPVIENYDNLLFPHVWTLYLNAPSEFRHQVLLWLITCRFQVLGLLLQSKPASRTKAAGKFRSSWKLETYFSCWLSHLRPFYPRSKQTLLCRQCRICRISRSRENMVGNIKLRKKFQESQ